MKKLLSLLLIICICFCAVGCNKVTDTNSSGLSSTITEIETETIYIDEQEKSTNDTTTEESKIKAPAGNIPSENTTPTQSTITSSTTTLIQESTPSSSETPTTSTDENNTPNEKDAWEELKKTLPDWTREPIASQIVDWQMLTAAGEHMLVLTNKNELYHLSADKKFSNGSHFKKIESEFKFEKLLYTPATCVLTTDNRLLQISRDFDTSGTALPTGDLVDITEKFKEEYPEIQKVEYKRYLTLSTHYDYEYYDYYENNNILCDGEVIYSFAQGENILLANQYLIQTNKGFYEYESYMDSEFVDSEPKLVIKTKFISDKIDDIFIKWYFDTWSHRLNN